MDSSYGVFNGVNCKQGQRYTPDPFAKRAWVTANSVHRGALSERFQHLSRDPIDVSKYITLPESQNTILLLCQCGEMPGIALDILLQLRKPVCPIAMRFRSFDTPRVLVPKASVNEYGKPFHSKYYVRLSRQVSRMTTVSKAQAVQMATQNQLGFSIFRRYPPHVFRAVQTLLLVQGRCPVQKNLDVTSVVTHPREEIITST